MRTRRRLDSRTEAMIVSLDLIGMFIEQGWDEDVVWEVGKGLPLSSKRNALWRQNPEVSIKRLYLSSSLRASQLCGTNGY